MSKVFLLSLLLLLSTVSATARKVVRVACVGNSITYGTGIANRERDAYPSQLQRLLGKDFVVGNFGKPGATLLRHGHRPYFLQTEFRDALQFKADIAVIHLGINDTDPRNWPFFRDDFTKDRTRHLCAHHFQMAIFIIFHNSQSKDKYSHTSD